MEKNHEGPEALQFAAHEFDMLTRLAGEGCAPEPLELLATKLTFADPTGEPLRAWLKTNPSFADKLAMALAACKSLEKIHAKGIVYRNISSRHLVFDAIKQRATWLNFDRATRLSRLKQNISHPSQLKGELAYFSPELTGRINRVVDWRSDLYGLGVLFYEAFSGELPFRAETPIEWVNAHLSQLAPSLSGPDIPPSLAQLVALLLAKNPEQRYASINGVIHDLERIQNGETDFPLRSRDYSQTFALPDRLYGREQELQTLEGMLQNINGPLQFAAIAAPSGMGKTALVEELKRTMSLKEAILCSGKFDQYNQGEPFSALANAIDDLARHILSWETSKYEAWRKRLLKGLNGNGRLITNLSPMMERILGEQPQLPEIEAELAAARVANTFYGFFEQCASQQHPVIFFIDDLQWVDSATMSILTMLQKRGGSINNIMMIHAYRDNELVAGGPYDKWLDQVSITKIKPQPLKESAVHSLLDDGFIHRISADDLTALSQLLDGRSGGSPFYLRELIANLIDKEAIYLDLEAAYWHFNAPAAAKIEFSADVAELLLAKIKVLPEQTQHILGMMSFVGREFSLANIMDCAGIDSTQQTAKVLWPAIENDLIAPLNEGFQMLLVSESSNRDFICRFVHDKVQAASQAFIPEEQRRGTKKHIAFSLLGERDPLSLGREAIVLADLITDAELDDTEAVTRRRLRLSAGAMARNASQHERALAYLRSAWEFQNAWQEDHRQDTLAVMTELAETLKAMNDVDGLFELDNEIADKLADPLDGAVVRSALMGCLSSNNRMRESVDRLIRFTNDLGYDIDLDKNPIRLIWLYIRYRLRMPNPERDIPALPKPDPRHIAIQTAMSDAGTALLTVEAERMPKAVLRNAYVITKEGLDTGGMLSFWATCIIFLALGHYKYATRHSTALVEMTKNADPYDEACMIMCSQAFILPFWNAKLPEDWHAIVLKHAEAIYRRGNIEICAGILNGPRITSITMGESLRVFRELMAQDYPQFPMPGEHYIRRYLPSFEAAKQTSLHPQSNLEPFVEPEASWNPAVKAEHYNVQVIWSTMLGIRLDAKTHRAWRDHELVIVGEPSVDRSLIFYDIQCSRQGPVPLGSLKDRMKDRIKRLMTRFKMRGLYASGSLPFQCMIGIARGCQAERKGKLKKALNHYQSAYEIATTCGSAREQLLAAEYSFGILRKSDKEGSFVWLQRALVAAEEYSLLPKTIALKEAYATEIAELHELFPQLKTTNVETKGSDDLDLATLIQAGADLAQAKDLPTLVETALTIITKNLSATRAQIWQLDAGEWQRLGGEGDVDATFLEEVYRSGEVRVIDDASTTSLSCQSALCIPLASGGQAIGLLVIENDTLTEAFPRGRLPFLKTLSNQIATAIANALLYAQMEAKVQEKARAMVAIMTHIEQGILTIDVGGKVAEDYSTALPQILGLSQIAGRDAIEILFGQTDLAADVIEQVEATLFASLGEDVINFEVNAERLVSELKLRNGKIIEIDWVPVTDDLDEVRNIMVTIRDVTLVRASQEAAEASAKELQRIGSLLALSPRQTRDFVADARTRLKASYERLTSVDPQDWLELNFRDLHTLKGVSRSYQFLDLAAKIHEVEEPYQAARHSAEALPDNNQLKAALTELLDMIAEYERIEHEVLKRGANDSLDLTQLKSAITRRNWQEVDALLAEDALNLKALLAPVCRSLPALAAELGRPQPVINFAISTSALDPSWGTTLLGALTHVLRNSVDHGLKTATSGEIDVTVADTGNAFEISVADAGRGLNLKALEQKCGAVSDEELAEAIFQSGLSTNEAVSDISGRGVGMDAVRAAIEELSGRVYVAFRAERDNDGYRKHRLVIELPKKPDTNQQVA